jgi:Tol biopolymer transport system component
MRWAFFPVLLGASVAAAGAGLSCGGGNHPTSGFGGSGGSSNSTVSGSTSQGDTGGSIFSTGTGAGGPYDDFPKDPIVDGSAPPNAQSLFNNAMGSDTGGPCLVEPEPNALFPDNWLRPRFRWVPTAGENLFELTLHTSGEVHDLVVYTANPSWTMDKATWDNVAHHVVDTPITMTIRGGAWDGMNLTSVSTGSSGPMTIAPAGAGGAVVYWTTSNGSSLKGFQVGDETVAQTLIPSQVQMQTDGTTVTCIGCHTSTPDGKYVGFTAQGPWGNALASVQTMNLGQQPPFMGTGALAYFNMNWPLGIESYSGAHWKSGDHKMLAPEGDSPGSKLVLIDLESTNQATAATVLNRGGETSEVGTPAWSHDGKTIVYTGGDGGQLELTGRLATGATYVDLFTVPYANGAGGTAKKIPGASDPNVDEFYPSFSPDDELLAFDSVPRGTNMYSQPLDELYVIPAAGGTASRLIANDPPACSGFTSPGSTNSWPKWSPTSTTVGKKTYYFLVFSSTRYDGSTPQLYMTGVVADGGSVKTYGSVNLWNQPATEHNHTPAWDFFKIPPAVPH